MNNFFKVVLYIACLGVVNIAIADTEANLSVFAGYRGGGEFEEVNTGEKLKIAETESIGFSYDWKYDANTSVILLYSHQETRFTNSAAAADVLVDLDIDYLHMGGIYHWPGKRVSPYLVGTLGITHYSPDGGFSSSTRGSLGFGLGSNIKLGESVGLKFEARGFSTLVNGDGAMFCGENGCRIFVSSETLWQYELQAGLVFRF